MQKNEGRDASVESFGAKRIRLRLARDGAVAFRFHTLFFRGLPWPLRRRVSVALVFSPQFVSGIMSGNGEGVEFACRKDLPLLDAPQRCIILGPQTDGCSPLHPCVFCVSLWLPSPVGPQEG